MRDIISASMENARPMPGDYPVNGILYCGRCNKPKEKRIEWVGKPVTVGIINAFAEYIQTFDRQIRA